MDLIYADVPCPLYDDWRSVVILPTTLTLAEQAAAVRELIEERGHRGLLGGGQGADQHGPG